MFDQLVQLNQLSQLGVPAGLSNAELLAASAHIYIDANTATTGPDTAITGLTADGLLGATLAVVGATAEIQKGANGLTFADGKFLRFSPTSVAYTKALTVVKFRKNAAPGGAGELLSLDISAGETHMLRYLSSGNFAITSAGTTALSTQKIANGDIVTIALWVDYTAGKFEVMDYDGFSNGVFTNTGAGAALNLTQMQIGQRCNADIMQAAVFLATGSNPLAVDLKTGWELVSGQKSAFISSNRARMMVGGGQSLDLGPTSSGAERAEIAAIARGNVSMHTGLVTPGNVQLHIHGPGNGPIDTAVPATGLTQAVAASNIPPRFMSAIVLNAHRADVGLAPIHLLYQGVSIAGVDILELDDDSPSITGTLGTTMIDNYAYSTAQLKAQAAAKGWAFEIEDMVILQGTADRTLAPGVWLAAAQEVFDDWKAKAATDPGILTPFNGLSVWQTGGDENTIGEKYHVKQDQIQLVINNGGTLIGPIHPIPLASGAHPGLPGYKIIAEKQAWAQAEVEAGNPWNIIPTAVRNGNSATVSFTLRPGETLVSDDLNYGGIGYAHHGFELTGATITSTTINPTSVTINADGPFTEIMYAMQEQDVSITSPGFSAHRGILRGSETKPAKLLFEGTLYREVSGFRLAV